MRGIKDWFDAYGESHQNRTNVMIHKICVPLIMLSLMGILWSIPRPDFFGASPFFNWATVFAAICMIFYFTLGILPSIVMLFEISAILYICNWVSVSFGNLLPLSITVFVLAWVGQFVGHKIEGKKPSFFEDLQFLLVGPLWISKGIFLKD